MLLEIQDLCSGYGRTPVLRDVCMTVGQGEIVALIGANGAGKSTLLNTIMGMVNRSAGDITFDGRSIARLPTSSIVRAGLAQVPERRQLFGTMTVEENLLMGAYTATDRAAIPPLLEEQFVRFPILRERRRQAAQTLSGGQQQMLAIARAMMASPRLLLLDEPSLGLAPIVFGQIIESIVRLRTAGGTVLIVEQNTHAALGVADRGYVLENGRVVLGGPAADLLDSTEVQDAYLGGHDGHAAIEGRIRARKQAILGR
jgi:branched-chain amino acid transport system ATP-binding protein